MKLEHSFDVPLDAEAAYAVLLDIERVVACMPGAALGTIDGDDFTGSVKVKLGPIGLTYKGHASLIEKDPVARRVVLTARGRDARGNGTADARVTATLTAAGTTSTQVDVVTDLDVTGKPAQFGRGVMVDVGNKLLGQFADALAHTLGDRFAERPPTEATAAPEPESSPVSVSQSTATPAPWGAVATADAIPLLRSVGPAIAKRVAPVIALVLLTIAITRSRSKTRA